MTIFSWRVVLLLVGVLVAGCAPWASYPPIEANSPLTSAELQPFPTLMAEALWHVNYEYGDGTYDFAYNLPPGTTELVFRRVAHGLGDGVGRPQMTTDQKAIYVKNVRARGADGEVDVVFPRSDGLYEMVTVSLRTEAFQGWRVTRDRRWRFPVAAPPSPTYPRAAASETVAEAPDATPDG